MISCEKSLFYLRILRVFEGWLARLAAVEAGRRPSAASHSENLVSLTIFNSFFVKKLILLKDFLRANWPVARPASLSKNCVLLKVFNDFLRKKLVLLKVFKGF